MKRKTYVTYQNGNIDYYYYGFRDELDAKEWIKKIPMYLSPKIGKITSKLFRIKNKNQA